MFEFLALFLWVVLTGLLAVGGFVKTKAFVRDRLRYVDLVRRPWIPFAAGAAVVVVSMPVTWLLPVVGTGTALLFGTSVGMGVASGRREFGRLPPAR